MMPRVNPPVICAIYEYAILYIWSISIVFELSVFFFLFFLFLSCCSLPLSSFQKIFLL